MSGFSVGVEPKFFFFFFCVSLSFDKQVKHACIDLLLLIWLNMFRINFADGDENSLPVFFSHLHACVGATSGYYFDVKFVLFVVRGLGCSECR